MTDDTDLARAERAFRRAFADHAASAPADELRIPGARRRRTVLVAVAAAAAVLAVVVPVLLLAGGGNDRPDDTAGEPADGMRWFGYLGVEVQVPADWPASYGAVRPDCIGPEPGIWDDDVPRHPYVEIEPSGRVVPAIGCSPDRSVRGPVEFGDLPLDLWQPYVRLDRVRPEYPGPADGSWQHQGWRLTRTTDGDVRVTVLAPPGRYGLADQVVRSLRRVDTDVNGCAATSPVQGATAVSPEGPAVSEPTTVAAVAVCLYERQGTATPGLLGSVQLDATDARRVAEGIRAAGEPRSLDEPAGCSEETYASREAVVLRFLDDDGSLIGEVHGYLDACFGSAFLDADGAHAMTEANCSPLFTTPPVTFWAGSREVFHACNDR